MALVKKYYGAVLYADKDMSDIIIFIFYYKNKTN
jgi:hypothetical protein